jgi:hypothetical protein
MQQARPENGLSGASRWIAVWAAALAGAQGAAAGMSGTFKDQIACQDPEVAAVWRLIVTVKAAAGWGSSTSRHAACPCWHGWPLATT